MYNFYRSDFFPIAFHHFHLHLNFFQSRILGELNVYKLTFLHAVHVFYWTISSLYVYAGLPITWNCEKNQLSRRGRYRILPNRIHFCILPLYPSLLVFFFWVICHLTAIIPGKLIFVNFCFYRFYEFDFDSFLFIIKVLREGQSKGLNLEKIKKYTCNLIKIDP